MRGFVNKKKNKEKVKEKENKKVKKTKTKFFFFFDFFRGIFFRKINFSMFFIFVLIG